MPDSPDRRSDGWVMFATILASSMAFIDGSALNVALPAVQSDLGSSGSQLLWLVSGYTLVLAAFILPGGGLGDRLGRKRVFLWGTIVFTAASASCAIAPSSNFLIAARLLQGAGGAAMIPGSLSVISAHFPPERRGTAIGTWSAATTITTAGGPVLGGVLAQAGLWRGVFLINVPLGIAASAALLLRVPESADRHSGSRIDLVGALTATIALAALTFGLISAPAAGFAAPRVAGGLVIGCAAAVLFLLIERRRKHPMVPLELFQNRAFTAANLLTLFLYGSLTVFTFFLPLAMVQAQGYRESTAGLTLLPFALILAAMSRAMGRLADRIGPRLPLFLGPLLVGGGFLLVSFAAPAGAPGAGGVSGMTGPGHSYWTSYFPGIVLFGIGMGTTVAPLTTTVMSSAGAGRSGTASGINNAVSRTAGVLFLALIGALALALFHGLVHAGVASLDLTPAERAAVSAETANLGNAQVPPGVHGATARELSNLITTAFLHTFRFVMELCTACAWLAAATVALIRRGEISRTM